MIEDAATTPPGGPSAVLLSRDLLFNSKITGTARELGHRVLVASTLPMATEMLTQWRPKVVFVDLAAGDFVETLAIVAFRAIVPESRFIAFGSHVDADRLDAARGAGCDPVLPRSKFTAMLPELIERYLGPGE